MPESLIPFLLLLFLLSCTRSNAPHDAISLSQRDVLTDTSSLSVFLCHPLSPVLLSPLALSRWMYTKKADKHGKIADKRKNRKEPPYVHKKQSCQVHRRVQENHRFPVPIWQNLRPNLEGIRRVLVRPLQLGEEIFPGEGR